MRAGFAGVLQVVPVDVGQQVAPGTNLARVADPSRLKAEIKIAETQAKDIQIGQTAAIDTRNGIVARPRRRASIRRCRTARVTVDVVDWTASCRRARVPDLSVDGTIELERLNDVLFIGRPAFGQEQSAVGAVQAARRTAPASRVQVKLGRELGEQQSKSVGAERRRSGDPLGHVRVGRVRSDRIAIGSLESR